MKKSQIEKLASFTIRSLVLGSLAFSLNSQAQSPAQTYGKQFFERYDETVSKDEQTHKEKVKDLQSRKQQAEEGLSEVEGRDIESGWGSMTVAEYDQLKKDIETIESQQQIAHINVARIKSKRMVAAKKLKEKSEKIYRDLKAVGNDELDAHADQIITLQSNYEEALNSGNEEEIANAWEAYEEMMGKYSKTFREDMEEISAIKEELTIASSEVETLIESAKDNQEKLDDMKEEYDRAISDRDSFSSEKETTESLLADIQNNDEERVKNLRQKAKQEAILSMIQNWRKTGKKSALLMTKLEDLKRNLAFEVEAAEEIQKAVHEEIKGTLFGNYIAAEIKRSDDKEAEAITEINKKMESQKETLENQNSYLKDRVTKLEKKVEALEAQITNVQGISNANVSKIDTITTRVGTPKSEEKDASGLYEVVGTEVAKVDKKVAAVKETADRVEGVVGKTDGEGLQLSFATVEAQVKTAETSDKDILARLSEVETKIDSTDDKSLAERVKTLEGASHLDMEGVRGAILAELEDERSDLFQSLQGAVNMCEVQLESRLCNSFFGAQAANASKLGVAEDARESAPAGKPFGPELPPKTEKGADEGIRLPTADDFRFLSPFGN